MSTPLEQINRSAIHRVLVQNKREWLGHCFHFAYSPQGGEYWTELVKSPETPLPPEAVAYLEELRASDIPEMEV
ncbi:MULTISPECIES: hypothetical protein [Sinorhizobium]|uniref:hypothetical protein n=1 Tax=Sinorhizobium TaxID=28105 RepID=UPI000BE9DB3D|nr:MULTISPECIES: hypothetical protein [Sinorhizobium]PDT55025.1 hypothetical protein CO664_08105 [Sinorhizobium sp. NG07B]POH32067.1 hypothetical protein ATY30_11745 [Sinorhizobium americanum]